MAENTGMKTGDMKSHLRQSSEKKPLKFAFGVGKDANLALLLLEKSGAPLAVEGSLKKMFPDVKNTRFGTAYPAGKGGEETQETEGEEGKEGPSLVKFYVNKAVTGMAKRLVKTLKGTGFTKVEILLEDGTPVESHQEAEEEAPKPQAQTGTSEVPPPPPQPQAEEPKPDPAELERKLKALIPQIPTVAGTNAELLARLKKFAIDGTTALKTNNLKYAAVYIEQLRRALEAAAQTAKGSEIPPPPPPQQPQQTTQAPQQQPQQPPTTGAVAFGKSRLAWLAARNKMASDIEKLRSEIVAHYADRSEGNLVAEIEKRYRDRVAPLLSDLDEQLADKLDEATNATDPEKRGKLVQEAKDLIGKYQNVVNGNNILYALDNNPFMPMAIQKTLTTTLSTIAAAVR